MTKVLEMCVKQRKKCGLQHILPMKATTMFKMQLRLASLHTFLEVYVSCLKLFNLVQLTAFSLQVENKVIDLFLSFKLFLILI